MTPQNIHGPTQEPYYIVQKPPLPFSPRSSAPGVSILRPLKGLDPNLSGCLESSFKQDYPNFEILLSVADEDDEALPIVHELIAKYPNVNARVVIANDDVGVNPKINNLMRPYTEAAHDILWILDSNVAVAPGTLARAVDILSRPSSSNTDPPRRRIALVHHVPFVVSKRSHGSFGAQVEEAFLNTNHAKMYIAINTVAVDSCVIGKSNLLRRSDLECLDGSLIRQQYPDNEQRRGLAAFGRFLAEDNMIALALWHELDLRHDLSYDIAYHTLEDMSLSDYVRRRDHMSLAAMILEPFTESVMLSAIVAMSLRFLTGIPIQLFVPAHFILWHLVDLDVYASLAGHPLPLSKWCSFLVAWLVRELLAFLYGLEWRGRRYRMLRNGEAVRVCGD
ncbi:glycosyltransferase family 21 protein [Lactifluus volemus]|nr:glycosyltransferase family 21 protein [Lactifluus volemus]